MMWCDFDDDDCDGGADDGDDEDEGGNEEDDDDYVLRLIFQEAVDWKRHFVDLHEMLEEMEYEPAQVRGKQEGNHSRHYKG